LERARSKGPSLGPMKAGGNDYADETGDNYYSLPSNPR
jgi:hypothetical protein